jgi:N4-gp56 family major capsid protein
MLNSVNSLNVYVPNSTTLGGDVIAPKIVERFLKVFEPELLFWKESEAPVSEENARSVIWVKPNRLMVTPSESLMQPGVTPPSTGITLDTIEVKSKQYGVYVTLTDELLDRMSNKNLPSVTTDLVSKNMARIMDRVVQDEVLDNATNRVYAATTP